MEFENPLDPIWKNLGLTRSSLNVARRSTRERYNELWKSTSYRDSIPSDTDFAESVRDIDELYVLALWAIFERRLIEAAEQRIGELGKESSVAFDVALSGYLLDGIVERWSPDIILDLFKGTVEPTLLGNAKQVKDYRDWLVHRNPLKDPESGKTEKITPDRAYRLLTAVLEAIHHATPSST